MLPVLLLLLLFFSLPPSLASSSSSRSFAPLSAPGAPSPLHPHGVLRLADCTCHCNRGGPFSGSASEKLTGCEYCSAHCEASMRPICKLDGVHGLSGQPGKVSQQCFDPPKPPPCHTHANCAEGNKMCLVEVGECREWSVPTSTCTGLYQTYTCTPDQECRNGLCMPKRKKKRCEQTCKEENGEVCDDYSGLCVVHPDSASACSSLCPSGSTNLSCKAPPFPDQAPLCIPTLSARTCDRWNQCTVSEGGEEEKVEPSEDLCLLGVCSGLQFCGSNLCKQLSDLADSIFSPSWDLSQLFTTLSALGVQSSNLTRLRLGPWVAGQLDMHGGVCTPGDNEVVLVERSVRDKLKQFQFSKEGNTPAITYLPAKESVHVDHICSITHSHAGRILLDTSSLLSTSYLEVQAGSSLTVGCADSATHTPTRFSMEQVHLEGALNVVGAVGCQLQFPQPPVDKEADDSVSIGPHALIRVAGKVSLTGSSGSAPLMLTSLEGAWDEELTLGAADASFSSSGNIHTSTSSPSPFAKVHVKGNVSLSSRVIEPHLMLHPGSRALLKLDAADGPTYLGDVTFEEQGLSTRPSSPIRTLLTIRSATSAHGSTLYLRHLTNCPLGATLRFQLHSGSALDATRRGFTLAHYAVDSFAARATFRCAIEVCGTEEVSESHPYRVEAAPTCIAVRNPYAPQGLGTGLGASRPSRRLLDHTPPEDEGEAIVAWEPTKLTVSHTMGGAAAGAAQVHTALLVLLAGVAWVAMQLQR